MRAHSSTPATRIRLNGQLDADGVRAARPTLEALATEARGDVVLDLSGVSLLDGSGVGAIAFLFKRLLARGCALCVAGASGQPLSLLRELGLTRILRMVDPAQVRVGPAFDVLAGAGAH
jgi:anti-anti-sigma factor